MSIHLRKIIRKAPIDSLQAYFESLSPGISEGVDWKASRTELAGRLSISVNALDRVSRDRVFSDFDRIGQFMNEHGRRMLRGVLPVDPEILDQFDALEDVTGCALFVLLRGDDTFENALSSLYAQRLLNGRDWTGLDFGPAGGPRMLDTPSLEEFVARLREIFTLEGPPPRILVDRFTRREPDPAGVEMMEREQFTIYVEAEPETAFAFGEELELLTHVQRPVLEAAVLFDSQEKTLDVVARGGGTERRRQIAEAFVGMMLVPGAVLTGRARRTLALDVLKTRPDFETHPEDRVRSVEVTRLTLRAPDNGSIVTIEIPGRYGTAPGADIYDRAERAFGRNGLPGRATWCVVGAKVRITFEPEARKRRTKRVVFELKDPDKTNLRDQIELHSKIADVLLARWGLYEGSA
ncbi:MAG: hypothetical protein HQ481_13510 [Alphaproteobacteria bacterium]|nr:hypothetical protein [Alphaproteobacteria bacterium]